MAKVKNNILIIDDEPELTEVLKEVLSGDDRAMYVAANGLEGLRVLEFIDIDLVISDIRMPDMNGVEFMETLYKKLRKHTPIILVSAYGDDILNANPWKDCVFGFLAKPLNIDELDKTAEKAIANGREHVKAAIEKVDPSESKS